MKEERAVAPPRQPQPSASATISPEKDESAESYTSRLLKAKHKVWEERKPE